MRTVCLSVLLLSFSFGQTKAGPAVPHRDDWAVIQQIPGIVAQWNGKGRVESVMFRREFATVPHPEKALMLLQQLPALRALSLQGYSLEPAQYAPIEQLPQLQVLQLGDTHFTDAMLFRLRGILELEVLGLEHTKISDDGLRSLATLKNLRVLDLGGNAITDRGMVHLKALPKLEVLILDDTRVTDQGLAQLSDMQSLCHLGLSNLPVSEQGFAHLYRLQNLHLLDLGSRRLSEDEKQALYQRLPKLRYNYSYAKRACLAAMPELKAFLIDDDPLQRHMRSMAMGRLRVEAEQTVPALTEALRNGAPVASQLFDIGRFSDTAAAALAEAALDPKLPQREAIARKLHVVRVSGVEPVLQAAAQSNDVTRRVLTMQVLAHLNIPSRAQLLIDGLADEKPVHDAAFAVLADKRSIDTVYPQLVDALSSDSVGTQLAAARIFGGGVYPDVRAMAVEDPEAIHVLVGLLNSSDQDLRTSVAFALRALVAPAHSALVLDPLANILSNPNEDSRIREVAASALANLGNEQANAILLRFKDDPDRGISNSVIQGLGRFPDSQRTVQALTATLADPDQGKRWHTILALDRLGLETEGVIPALLNALSDPEHSVSFRAAQALADEKAAVAVPQMIAALDTSTAADTVAFALGQIGAPAAPAIPKLVEMLVDRNFKGRRDSVARAINSIARKDKDATIRFMVELTHDKGVDILRRAARRLGKYDHAYAAATEALKAVEADAYKETVSLLLL